MSLLALDFKNIYRLYVISLLKILSKKFRQAIGFYYVLTKVRYYEKLSNFRSTTDSQLP